MRTFQYFAESFDVGTVYAPSQQLARPLFYTCDYDGNNNIDGDDGDDHDAGVTMMLTMMIVIVIIVTVM